MANKQTENEATFLSWLSSRVSPSQMSELSLAFNEIEKQAKKTKIVHTSIYESLDIASISRIRAGVERSKIFRFTHKRQWNRILSALGYLQKFASKKPAEDEVKSTAPSEIKQGTSEIVGIIQEAEATVTPQEKTEEKPSFESRIEATVQRPKMATTDNVVNFDSIGSLAFTKPVSISYFEDVRPESSWKALYVDACALLFDDYPDIFRRLRSENVFGSGKKWLADAEHIDSLAVPKKVADKRATITSSIEHHAVLNSCRAIERLGFPVVYLTPTDDGIITPDALRSVITNRTRLVSVMFANNEIGTIQPIKKLSLIAHEYGALFHTDAVQAVGHVHIDVNELGIDMLSASAHKFNGPKGVGFLYIRKGTDIRSFNDGGAQEKGMRAGTENVAGIVGMAKALEGNCEKISAHRAEMIVLEHALINTINDAGLDYLRNGSADSLPGSISLSFKNSDGEMLLHRLDLMGISISTGSACDSNNTQVSHVIQAIKVPADYAKGTIRISFGKYNSVEDAVAIGRALAKVCNQR